MRPVTPARPRCRPPGDDDIILRMDGRRRRLRLHHRPPRDHPRGPSQRHHARSSAPTEPASPRRSRRSSGCVRVRSGHIWYDGDDIVGLSQVELLRRGISFVPQGRNIFPWMTVRANLELGGVSLGDLPLTRGRIERHRLRAVPDAARRRRTSRPARSAAASRRCWRSAGPCCSSHACCSSTSRRSVSRRSSSSRCSAPPATARPRDHRADDRAERQARPRDERLRHRAPAGAARRWPAPRPRSSSHPEIGHLFLGGVMRSVS